MILKPSSTLLIGGTGSGKTTSLVTYLHAGLKLFVVVTEPGGEESLIDACGKHKVPLDNLHYMYVPFARTQWDTMEQLITNVSRMNFQDLANLKGIKKENYRQMFELYGALTNFTCDRTGQEFGPVDDFDDTCALAIDSLSGINNMCRTLVVGAKPAPAQGEWGVMMNVEMSFIDKLTSDLKCFFALTAHVQKTYVEAEGRTLLAPMCVTRSLGDSIPRMFSDVVMTTREGSDFYWTTMESRADLKARNLPFSAKLEPTFAPIVEAYRRRKEAIASGGEAHPTRAPQEGDKPTSASTSKETHA